MRGAPQRRFSLLMHLINARKSAAIGGRPPSAADFRRQ
jgi:hypothetical protein